MFFLHVDELAIRVVELILQEGQLLTGNDADAQPVLHLPAALQRPDSLVDEGCHIGMDVQRETLDAYLVDETVDLAL